MVYFSDRKNAGKCNDRTVSGGDGGGADRRAAGPHPPHAGAGHGSTIARSVDSGRRFVPHDRIDYEKWYPGIARRVCLACAGSIYHRRRRDLCADRGDCSSKAATEQTAYGEQYRSELSRYPQ